MTDSFVLAAHQRASHGQWLAVEDADHECISAHTEVASEIALRAITAHERADANGSALGVEAGAALRMAITRCDAFLTSRPARWSLLGPSYEQRIRGLLELMLAATLDICGSKEGDAARALEHYARWAALCGTDRLGWQLWVSCSSREDAVPDAASRAAAVASVTAKAVARGVWRRPEQRSAQFIDSLATEEAPWLDPSTHPVCMMLAAHYDTIRAEGVELLKAAAVWQQTRAEASANHMMNDGRVRTLVDRVERGPADGTATAAAAANVALPAWRDVSLYVNGRRHERHAALAPRTSALLSSAEGTMLREAASCVYGSAFFSLLAPGTRLRPHCGPTNVRLRCHLALVVPEGDCAMRVGCTPPRQWVEGAVSLFDDSYEHEVWNATEAPRLVLIVDVWHPELVTDDQRLATLDPSRARLYHSIVREGKFESLEDFEACARARQKPAPLTEALRALCAAAHRRALGGSWADSPQGLLFRCLHETLEPAEEGDVPIAVPFVSSGDAGEAEPVPAPAAAIALARPVDVPAAMPTPAECAGGEQAWPCTTCCTIEVAHPLAVARPAMGTEERALAVRLCNLLRVGQVKQVFD